MKSLICLRTLRPHANQTLHISIRLILLYLYIQPLLAVWHKSFAVFPAIHKNKFPRIPITANIFPAKSYSRVNILQLKFATQKYSTKKSCLFNHNSSLSFRNNEIMVYCLKICVSITRTQEKRKYYQCYVQGTFYKPQNLIPWKKNQSVLIAKISSRKTQKIANRQK